LLKVIVGGEFLDEERHPVSTKHTTTTENVAVRATMQRDTVDLRGHLFANMLTPGFNADDRTNLLRQQM